MTFFSNAQENITAADARNDGAESHRRVYVEETPCVVIRAVDVSDVAAQARWQPRTLVEAI